MNTGSAINSPGGYNFGPSTFQAIIGNPSPTLAGQTQLVESAGTSWFDALKAATRSAVTAAIGPGPAAVDAVAKGAEALGQGAKAAGAGVGKAATSAASGIKIGFVLVVVLIGIVLIAQVRGALRT